MTGTLRRGALGLAVGTLLAAVALTGPVGAQTAPTPDDGADPTPAGAPPLTLVEQTAWVPADGTFSLLLAAPDAPDDGLLAVTVHDAVGSRIAFARSVTGEDLGGDEVALDPLPLALLPRDTGDTIVVTLGPDVTGQLPGSGVYPVDVTLLAADGSVLHRLITHLVRLPGDTASPPLAVAPVLPIDASPALQPDGTAEIDDDDLDRLDVVADALVEHPGLALSVEPTPETVAALSRVDADPAEGELLDQLRAGVAPPDAAAPLPIRQVLAGSYVDVDVAAWVPTSLGGDPLAAQLTSGDAALDETLDVRADRRTWVTSGSTTPQALSRLTELGVDQVVLPEAALQQLDAAAFPVTLTQPFEVADADGELRRAAAADTALLAHVGSTGDPVLDAHHLLADLAVLYFDRPALTRGVPLPLLDHDLPRSFLDAFLGALEQPQSVLASVTLDALFATVPDAEAGGEATTTGQPLVRSLVPTTPADLGGYPDDVALTRLTLVGYEALVGPDHPALVRLDELTLTSGDDGLDGAAQRAYLAAVSEQVQATVDAIVTPEDQTITLTSRSGTIPLRLRNDNAFPVQVLVDLQSERLEFPDGEQIPTTLPPGETQLDVRVNTRASGAFPLEASVASPDGVIDLSTTEYTVRSTALSGVGIVLSVGAGLILLVWWGRHFRDLRRNRALVSANGHPAGGHPGDGTTSDADA